jgi:hypothetical protein
MLKKNGNLEILENEVEIFCYFELFKENAAENFE